ncbi:MAG TPA: HAMP domain-containing sensor histidine kinase [Streptosporangiaceae bacterium]
MTEQATPRATFRDRLRWPEIGVRAWVLATGLALTALAMALAGTVSVLVQRSAATGRADLTIGRDVAEFRALARTGNGPGRPFTTVSAVLQAGIQRQVPAEDETYLGLVNGQPAWIPSGQRPVQLEDQPGIVRTAAQLGPAAPVQIRQASTRAGEIRYAVVQVKVAGQPQTGSYVVAIATARDQQVILAGARQYALVALGSLLLVGLVGWLVAGQLLRPLRLLRTAAERISHTDLSLRIPVSGRDDVTELTRTVNAMLDRLDSAFAAQQRFLDDAGHELRTPVTVVRGHLEVLDVRDPQEVAEVRDLALDELDRTGRLIGDLTLLAKARRPDFVHPGPVDLAQLTGDVAGKASALGPRQWTVEARAEAVFRGDEQRLTQALLQLADNAVRHTKDGDEIAIGSSVSRAQVRLWVRDQGPGVAAEDKDRIFERFGRAASAAGRNEEGSGLGLAIVAAIAEAHGGRIVLDSVPGHGATFTLVLPVNGALS